MRWPALHLLKTLSLAEKLQRAWAVTGLEAPSATRYRNLHCRGAGASSFSAAFMETLDSALSVV